MLLLSNQESDEGFKCKHTAKVDAVVISYTAQCVWAHWQRHLQSNCRFSPSLCTMPKEHKTADARQTAVSMCFSVWKYHQGQQDSKRARYGVMSGLIIQSRLRLITQILLGEGEEWWKCHEVIALFSSSSMYAAPLRNMTKHLRRALKSPSQDL